jgi:hypothetical protein
MAWIEEEGHYLEAGEGMRLSDGKDRSGLAWMREREVSRVDPYTLLEARKPAIREAMERDRARMIREAWDAVIRGVVKP